MSHKTPPGPRCRICRRRLRLRPDGTWECRGHRTVFMPLDPDLVSDLRATPGVRFLDGPGHQPPYVLVEPVDSR